MQLRKRKNEEPQAEEPIESREGGTPTAKRTKKVHWPVGQIEASGAALAAEQSTIKVKKVTLKITSQQKREVEGTTQSNTDEASLTIEELENLVRQERVLGTAKRRGPKTEAVLARFTNSRIVYLQGLIALRASSSTTQSRLSKAPHDAPQPPEASEPPPSQLQPISSTPAVPAAFAMPTTLTAPVTLAAPAMLATPATLAAPATLATLATPSTLAALAAPVTLAMPAMPTAPAASAASTAPGRTHTTPAAMPAAAMPATCTSPATSVIRGDATTSASSNTPATVTRPPPSTSATSPNSTAPVNPDTTPTVVSKLASSSSTTAGGGVASEHIPSSFPEAFRLHSPSPEPYQLVSDFDAGDEEDSESAEKDRKIRPGPLTNEQKAQCHTIAEEYAAKMLQIAEEWGVHETTVSRQCGLGVKEHRGPNQWCIWQERWFPENPQRATETKEEWRERCSREYDSAKEGLSDEERKAFRQELLDWRAKHEREEANIQIDKEGCWRKMKEVEATLLEWGAHLSTHWGIEIVGALLSTLPGDLTGRAASVLIGGSNKARSWWNANTPAAKVMLHDLELSAGEYISTGLLAF
ncbi:hypothetical protein BOTBODRAFT_175689 [Botryobasidium botryosum FD-172 SS1]|uniref:Uncharacterized protein n=1 Tax=Botryobasidium botryosum (strain FD-172 SS1) TaxID=930990 RepID=A0A067MCX6_BOTB1|nr:hypothetical protein BOTBODRAFT_175689 [Botryobasidium botryosum FD-172 SS1]